MSMSAGGGTGHAVSEINVTPLIDVLLVLLIIFMVLVPLPPKGLAALIPQTPKTPTADPPATIVVELRANGTDEPTYKINQTAYAKRDVEAKLAATFAMRQDKVMFVQADAGLEFGKVAEVVDMAHRADVQSIGLLTQRDMALHHKGDQ